MATLRTACPLDCPDACSLAVEVENGIATRIDATLDNTFTQGFICSKVRRFPRRVYGDARLRSPLRRIGAKGEGRFEEIGWSEAYDAIADAIERVRDQAGAEAILPLSYGGSNGALTQDTTDARFFARLGASRLKRSVCAAATGAAISGIYASMPGVAPEDYPEAALIVVWGANPSAANIHLVPILQRAQRAGTILVVIDPRRTPLAAKADLHLQLHPGTDLPVALSLHRWLFESGAADRSFIEGHTRGSDALSRRSSEWSFERAADLAGVDASDLDWLARSYAKASPALIRCGWGLERNRNGGSAVAAVLALPAVAGKFGVRGGGYTLSNSRSIPLRSDRAAAAREAQTRIVNMNHVGRLLNGDEGPPVDLLFVYNNNPVATLPDQEAVKRGLAREDLFTVVFDQVHTDTVPFADIVLPATTFLEHHDLRVAYGPHLAQDVTPIVDRVGEAKPNYEVFEALCDRLGLDQPDDPLGVEGLRRALASDRPRILEDLAATGLVVPETGGRPVQMVDLKPDTPDGRIDLFPEHLDREAPEGLYAYQPDPATHDYPLALLSPSTHRTTNSSLGELYRDQAVLEMATADANPRGLASGDLVRIHNRLGEVHCAVRLSPNLRPGVVVLPKGIWSHNTRNGATSNALVNDSLTDLGGGATFNDCRVEVVGLVNP
ncbi:MAG: molybdopterin-dependent oxidoreductase [Acidobacteriota bacterium]|nr:molybdopterin-dependent oxidoreductase [Acidobacteriota bacterium]